MRATILSVLLLVPGLGACTPKPPPLSVTDEATLTDCRAHAEQVYERNNRGRIYSIGDNGAPNSSIGLMGNPTQGLSDVYAHDRMIERCVRGMTPSGAAAVVPATPTIAPPR